MVKPLSVSLLGSLVEEALGGRSVLPAYRCISRISPYFRFPQSLLGRQLCGKFR
ncbi:hypothetical protein [Treponema endosymbiont of Eucomonympha sp.]|uniref:hypothetical protein n=1 Tax=Treponema endosymbiont of Eucomonympha sp. TaxID=1580831 RepID=UPI00164EED81|nr:hypothetical protein [Treponema endosymbiont of Eucomonympha sp.]